MYTYTHSYTYISYIHTMLQLCLSLLCAGALQTRQWWQRSGLYFPHHLQCLRSPGPGTKLGTHMGTWLQFHQLWFRRNPWFIKTHLARGVKFNVCCFIQCLFANKRKTYNWWNCNHIPIWNTVALPKITPALLHLVVRRAIKALCWHVAGANMFVCCPLKRAERSVGCSVFGLPSGIIR